MIRAMLLLYSVVAAPCHADEGLFWATPHIADVGVSWAVLRMVEGTEEISPFGFSGVAIAKAALEGAALGYRDAGDVETCQALAGGARWGGWIGTGTTLGGLAGGLVWVVNRWACSRSTVLGWVATVSAGNVFSAAQHRPGPL